MLCGICYKKIPEGKEVQIVSSSGFIRANWGTWGGTEILCLRCVKKERKERKRYWKAITIVFLGAHFFIIVLLIALILVKGK